MFLQRRVPINASRQSGSKAQLELDVTVMTNALNLEIVAMITLICALTKVRYVKHFYYKRRNACVIV